MRFFFLQGEGMQHKRESKKKGGINQLLGNEDLKLLQLFLLWVCP